MNQKNVASFSFYLIIVLRIFCSCFNQNPFLCVFYVTKKKMTDNSTTPRTFVRLKIKSFPLISIFHLSVIKCSQASFFKQNKTQKKNSI